METFALTAAALSFDAEKHEYRLPDGRLVPSVTQILHGVGVATDFERIMSFGTKIAEAIEFRRALGTAAHADCHAFDDNDLDWDRVDERVRPYVEAWGIFRENTGLMPIARERRVLHHGSFYCGTLDGILLKPNGTRVLVDIKLGDPEDAAAQFQTAAYEAAYLLDHPDDLVSERWAVRLLPDRRVPYDITNYSARPEAWRDFSMFQAFATTYHAQAIRRRSR
jgi:hypothetical protein